MKSRAFEVASELLDRAPVRTFILLVAIAGCLDAPAPTIDETSDVEQDATTAFANDKPAFDFFIGKGLTPFQAAGIVGNLDQESGVNPNSVQSGGPGRGIAQWSVGGRWDTSSGDNAVAYASQQGMSVYSLQLQLQFIWYELTHFGYGLTQLKATTNVTDATVEFMTRFEICGTCIQTQRVAYAKAVLAAYGQIPYGASYVSQSWPLASKPAMQVKCGEKVAASITLKNTGTKPWTSATKLGTTEPRDRDSIFAGADWVAPNRAAAISGSVAPGEDGTFTFAFDGPTGDACVPGTYSEHFGVVQDGTAWFSDTANGGPPDDQIEAKIELVPGDDPGSGSGSDPTGDPTAPDGGCAVGGNGGLAVALAGLALARRRRASCQVRAAADERAQMPGLQLDGP